MNVGDSLPELKKGPITRDDLKAYAAASGDPNPIHIDEEFAKNAGHPTVFAHGMLSMGYLGEFVVRAAGGDPAKVRKLRARFARLTWPGDVITCKGTVTAVREESGRRLADCDIWTEDQKGERKVTGSATIEV